MTARPLSLWCLCLAGSALANDWSVAAQVSHAAEGPPDTLTGRPVLVQHFTASCTPPPGVGTPKYSSEGIVTRFVARPDTEYRVSGAMGVVTAAPHLSGSIQTSTAVLGARVFPEMRVVCGAGLASPSAPLTVRGAPLTTAPWVSPRLAVVSLDGADVGPDADEVPVGAQVRLLAFIESSPRGPEQVVVHVEGPGVQVERRYGEADGDVTKAFNEDPQAVFRATASGTLRVWAEFEGLRSEVRTLSIVARDVPPGEETPPSGCSSVGALEVLAALCLLARKAVRS